MAEQITQEDLAQFLPEGATIKHVQDRQGKPVINVCDALSDWQAAVPVGDDIDGTVEQIIRAAWVQEHHMRHLLLLAEEREVYREKIAGLQSQLESEKLADINNALANRKQKKASST